MVDPLSVEAPRSMVLVVTSWNIPMSRWLRTCESRPAVLTRMKKSLTASENKTLEVMVLKQTSRNLETASENGNIKVNTPNSFLASFWHWLLLFYNYYIQLGFVENLRDNGYFED